MILYPILEHRRSAHFYLQNTSVKNATGMSTPMYDGVDPLNRFLMMLLAVPSGQSLHLYVCHPIRQTLFAELLCTRADKHDQPVRDGCELPVGFGPLVQAILEAVCACARWVGTCVGILVRYLIEVVLYELKRYAQSRQKAPPSVLAPPSDHGTSMLQVQTEPQGEVQYKRMNVLGRDHFVPIGNNVPRARAPDYGPKTPTAQSTVWPWTPKCVTSQVSPPSLASSITSSISKLRLSSSLSTRRRDPICFPITAYWDKQKSYKMRQRPRSDFDDSAWVGYRDDDYRDDDYRATPSTNEAGDSELDVATHLKEVEVLQSFVHKVLGEPVLPSGPSPSSREGAAKVAAKPKVSAQPLKSAEPAEDPLAHLKAFVAQGSLWSKTVDNTKEVRTADPKQGVKEHSYETKGRAFAARDAAPIHWQSLSSASTTTGRQPPPLSLVHHEPQFPALVPALPAPIPAYQASLPALAFAPSAPAFDNPALASVMADLGLPIPQVGAPQAYLPQVEDYMECEQTGLAQENFYMPPQQQPTCVPFAQEQPFYASPIQEQPVYMQPTQTLYPQQTQPLYTQQTQPLYTQQVLEPQITGLPAFADWEPTYPIAGAYTQPMQQPILPAIARLRAEAHVTPQRPSHAPANPPARYPNGVEKTTDPRLRNPATQGARARVAEASERILQRMDSLSIDNQITLPSAPKPTAPALQTPAARAAYMQRYNDLLGPSEPTLPSAQAETPRTPTRAELRAAQLLRYNDLIDNEQSVAEALRSSA
ncbi:hypothetical protein EWM64_g324 [Hericium alpestre]|uniref:Uncharacterized protein n=1 Tax=Hericium alpestre TaxID=135208 RepID=A0A4Z0ABF0_9AGAM|nr:hypothetical protein EWM64_g324 [Hericium alpestre]